LKTRPFTPLSIWTSPRLNRGAHVSRQEIRMNNERMRRMRASHTSMLTDLQQVLGAMAPAGEEREETPLMIQ